MTDLTELVHRLRHYAFGNFNEAADAIEAQAREIAALTAKLEAAEETARQHDKLRAAAFGTLKHVSAHLETATEALQEIADHDGGASAGLAFTAQTALREIGGGNG